MERNKYFSSFLYGICEGLIFFFFCDPEENTSDGKK